MSQEITQTITGYVGVVPNKSTQTKLQFNAAVDTLLPWLTGNTAELNTFAGQANALATAVNADAVAAEAAKDTAESAATVSAASTNFLGAWDDQTGAQSVPAAVYHDGLYWILLESTADITADEPGTSVKWALLAQSSICYHYTAPGSYTWTKPSNATLILLEAFGAGAGGRGGGINGGSVAPGGNGGSGGGYQFRRATPEELGATESVVVGAGGAGGPRSSTIGNGPIGTDGGDSYVGAPGGHWVFGQGGAADGEYETVAYEVNSATRRYGGGDGGSSSDGGHPSMHGGCGGGGGGAENQGAGLGGVRFSGATGAGDSHTGAGVDGTAHVGASGGGFGGYDGGDGVYRSNGGGGGGSNTSGIAGAGGDGADGEVRITVFF